MSLLAFRRNLGNTRLRHLLCIYRVDDPEHGSTPTCSRTSRQLTHICRKGKITRCMVNYGDITRRIQCDSLAWLSSELEDHGTMRLVEEDRCPYATLYSEQLNARKLSFHDILHRHIIEYIGRSHVTLPARRSHLREISILNFERESRHTEQVRNPGLGMQSFAQQCSRYTMGV